MKKLSIMLSLLLVICMLAPILSVFAEESEINIAKGVKYTITTGEPITQSYSSYEENGEKLEIDNGQLSDGNIATESAEDSAWYRAYRGRSRIVVFDFGDKVAVSAVKASFLNDKSKKITAPRYINVFLSEDGVRYAHVSDYETNYKTSINDAKHAEFNIKLGKSYGARFVKIEYSVETFSYCDEIEIIGRNTLNGKESKIRPTSETQPLGYIKSVAGVSDTVTLYNGYSTSSFSKEMLMPYVAYIGINGAVSGKMFDSAVITPHNTVYPSGGSLYFDGEQGSLMSDWELYLDYLFKKGGDLSVLDQTVGEVYSTLGIKEKFKVFLALPYPKIINRPFGDIDSDGLDEYCNTLSERVDVAKWYVNECISMFLNNEYKNISLVGFSWCVSEIDPSYSEQEIQFVKNVNKYIEQKRIESVCSFGYLYAGFDNRKELGFSGASMKSGYANSENGYGREMLSEYALSAYNNNLGVEIELWNRSSFDSDSYADAAKNYENQLFAMYKSGCMNSFKIFTETDNNGVFGILSKSEITTPKGINLRRLYDLTYQFIHGTYKNNAPVVSVPDIELIYGEERVLAEISIEDNDTHWDDIVIEFPKKPQHGNITVSADKQTLIFQPEKDFTGKDSFTVIVSDGFNNSEEIEVAINVINNDTSIEEVVSDTIEETEEDPQKDTVVIPPWLMIIVLILVGAVVAVAVVVIIKSLKK